MKKMKLLLSLLFTGWFVVSLQAQTTVGVDEDALPGAIMQWKQVPDGTTAAKNANKGLAFPRVELSDINKLYPMFLKDQQNKDSGDSDEYSANQEAFNQKHTGLVVYNLTSNTEKKLFRGLNEWDGSQWVSLLSSSPRLSEFAVFEPFDCNRDITGIGEYLKGIKPDDEDGNLILSLEVKDPGRYTITTDEVNGCKFSAEGIALERNEQIDVELEFNGTPDSDGTFTYQLFINNNKVCEFSINVDTSEFPRSPSNGDYASYQVLDVRANGTYAKRKNLDKTNVIEIDINVTKAGCYSISSGGRTESTTSTGISFPLKQGTFSGTGAHTITLQGTGRPLEMEPITVTVSFDHGPLNSIENHNVIIPIAPQGITYAVIGTNPHLLDDVLSTYFWSRGARANALESKKNFGTEKNSVVKVNNFHQLWEAKPSTAANYLTNGYGSNQEMPDIVLYNTYGATIDGSPLDLEFTNFITPELADALAEYVRNKGCLIFGAAHDLDVPFISGVVYPDNLANTNTMLQKIYKNNNIMAIKEPKSGKKCTDDILSFIPRILCGQGPAVGDDLFLIKNDDPNDPVIKGPFGNLSGKYWGEDNRGNVYVEKNNLPNTAIQICSAHNEGQYQDLDPEDSIVWYDSQYNLFFFGDSAGCSSKKIAQNLLKGSFPAVYDKDGNPKSKEYGLPGNKQDIYNAHLELNAVAWAINRALTNGINSH